MNTIVKNWQRIQWTCTNNNAAKTEGIVKVTTGRNPKLGDIEITSPQNIVAQR